MRENAKPRFGVITRLAVMADDIRSVRGEDADLAAFIEARPADPSPDGAELRGELNPGDAAATHDGVAHERLCSVAGDFDVDTLVCEVVDRAVLHEQRLEIRRLNAGHPRAGDRQPADDDDVGESSIDQDGVRSRGGDRRMNARWIA